MFQRSRDEVPCDDHDHDVTMMDFVAGDSGAEADLTVDSTAGVVIGRVAGSDGRVFLVEEAANGDGHVWLEVEIPDDAEQGEDTVEPVRPFLITFNAFCYVKLHSFFIKSLRVTSFQSPP